MILPGRFRTAIALSGALLLTAGTLPAQTPRVDPADVGSIDAIVTALYDVISGPAHAPRDWDRMRSLFIPDARLIPTGAPQGGPAQAFVLSLDDWIERAEPAFMSNGFFEREATRTVEEFGRIAHVFSTYESRRAGDEPDPFQRGINSIQLLNDGTRWWVVSVFWDAERPGNPIPQRYLP